MHQRVTEREDPRRYKLINDYETFVGQYAHLMDYVRNLEQAIIEKLVPGPNTKAIKLTPEFIEKLQKAKSYTTAFSRQLVSHKEQMIRLREALVTKKKLSKVRRQINMLRDSLSKLTDTTFTSLKNLKLKIKHVYHSKSENFDMKRSKLRTVVMTLFMLTAVVGSPIKKMESSDFKAPTLSGQEFASFKSGPTPGGGGGFGLPPPTGGKGLFDEIFKLLKNLQKIGEDVAKDLLKEGTDPETLYVKMGYTSEGDAFRAIIKNENLKEMNHE